MNHILLIEDNEQLQKYICEYLCAYGYIPHILSDYDLVIETMQEISPRLILLDIMLPRFDGFYFLKLIRKHTNVPIIIISARSEESEQVRGIEGGADDYITKPFSAPVLMAKINAMLKRNGESAENSSFGSLSLLADSMELCFEGNSLSLTKNEFRIMRLLIKNAGEIVAREQILETLWDDKNFIDDNTLTVNMTRIKKKLAEIGLSDVIATRRGIGYVFNGAGL